jgi:hypothetical protein
MDDSVFWLKNKRADVLKAHPAACGAALRERTNDRQIKEQVWRKNVELHLARTPLRSSPASPWQKNPPENRQ